MYILTWVSVVFATGLAVTMFLLLGKQSEEVCEPCDEAQSDSDQTKSPADERDGYSILESEVIGQSTIKYVDSNNRPFIFEFRLNTGEVIDSDGWENLDAEGEGFSVDGTGFSLQVGQSPYTIFDPTADGLSSLIETVSFGGVYRWRSDVANVWDYSAHVTTSGRCEIEMLDGDYEFRDCGNSCEGPISSPAPCGWVYLRYPSVESEDEDALGLAVVCEVSTTTGLNRCDELLRTVVVTPYTEPSN